MSAVCCANIIRRHRDLLLPARRSGSRIPSPEITDHTAQPKPHVASRASWPARFAMALFLPALTCLLLARALSAQTVTAVIPTIGVDPGALAVNLANDGIYVADFGGDGSGISIISGETYGVNFIPTVGTVTAAANPVTNRAYLETENGLSVVDGSTNTIVATVTGDCGGPMAINPQTNTIYIANKGIATLCVINGNTNTETTTVPIGPNPWALAVNPLTNTVYVANCAGISGPYCPYSIASGTVTVINGTTNTVTATLAAGLNPAAVAVNSVTNKVYVTGAGGSTVTVIDGATNSTSTIAVQLVPTALVVNATTNTIYVLNSCGTSPSCGGPGSISVINGETDTVTETIPVTGQAVVLTFDPVTNWIFVSGGGGGFTVIDGTTNSVIDTALDFSVYGVNPVTHKLYTPNGTANTVTVIDESVNSTTAVAAGTNPSAAAVNPATNTAYLTNSGSNNVTVINGATNSTTTIAAGTDPDAVAVNPVTNTAYVANFRSDTVTVINGATGSTATVATGTQPVDVAINPATDTIYVANSDSGNVTVIAGATNSTATVEVGTNPAAIAVNPITNSAYVANEGSNNVTVISGFANHTSTIPVGNQPDAVAANPVTNMIYVANLGSDSVSVVNGATNTVSATVAAGGGPSSIAVDPISNTVYVANKFSGSLTVINGATNSATTVSTGVAPSRIAIDPANNKVYTANSGSNNITAIDGASNAANTVAAGTAPVALAANPATDTVYAANSGSGNATVLTPNAIAAIPLTTAVQGVVDSQTVAGLAIYATTNPSPSFTAVATSSYTPIAPPPTAVYYQLDTEQGPWQMATDTTALGANPATFGFQLSGVALGVHVVYAYATYGLEATTGASWVERIGKAPEIGNITAYVFAVLALPPTPTSVTLASSLNPSLFGQSVTFTATVNPSVGPTGTITFFDASTALATVGLASGMATYTTSSLAVGTHPMTAAYSGDDNYSPSTSPVLNQVVLLPVATGDFAISASPAAQIVKGGSEAAYNVTVTSLDGFAGPVGLSCSGLPADATCSFAQSTVILVANGTAQTTMTVSTTAADAELRRFGNSDLGFGTSKPSAHGGDTAALFARMIVPFDCSGLAVFLAGVLGRRNAKRRRRRSLRVLGLVALTLVLVGMTSCGCPSTVHQDYTITVTGTSGTLVHSTSVELIVDLQKNQ